MTDREREQATTAGWTSVTMGPNVLCRNRPVAALVVEWGRASFGGGHAELTANPPGQFIINLSVSRNRAEPRRAFSQVRPTLMSGTLPDKIATIAIKVTRKLSLLHT